MPGKRRVVVKVVEKDGGLRISKERNPQGNASAGEIIIGAGGRRTSVYVSPATKGFGLLFSLAGLALLYMAYESGSLLSLAFGVFWCIAGSAILYAALKFRD